MLASHQQGDHDIRNLLVRQLLPVLVGALHQIPNHVQRLRTADVGPGASSLVNDVGVDGVHAGMGGIALLVMG